MGAVYVVEQLSTGKRRALKLMLPSAAMVDGTRRFEQEARTSSLIPSEHVVDVIAAGVDGPEHIPWLAMELLEGESLEDYLERSGPLSTSQAHEILSQLAHALSAAHDLGVVHRDLKPDNIFLARSRISGREFMVKVLDFGLATVVEATTRNTTALGSPLWMAPEQTQTNASISLGTDVWAIGLIVFRMLSGRHYWRAVDGSLVALMREILLEPLPPASARSRDAGGADLPAGVDEWFGRCVARAAEHRFAHARDAWQQLQILLVNAGATPIASSAVERMPTAPPPGKQSAPMAGVAGETALSASKTLLSPTDVEVQHWANAIHEPVPSPPTTPKREHGGRRWLLLLALFGALAATGAYLLAHQGSAPAAGAVTSALPTPRLDGAPPAEPVLPPVAPAPAAPAALSDDAPAPAAPSASSSAPPGVHSGKTIRTKPAPSAKPPHVETKPEKPSSTLPDLL
jgi:serine/threonine protein kinase